MNTAAMNSGGAGKEGNMFVRDPVPQNPLRVASSEVDARPFRRRSILSPMFIAVLTDNYMMMIEDLRRIVWDLVTVGISSIDLPSMHVW